MSREYIANVLKRLRENSGLTADQVGKAVGKSGKTVNAWENNRGQPDAEMLMKLCDIYKVDDILAEFKSNKDEKIVLTKHEKRLVSAYRNKPEMQQSVDKLLDIGTETSNDTLGNNIGEDIAMELMKSVKNINTK